jgi:hypothetical protein
VAKELLDGADVVAGLQEVGGEGVAEGVGANRLGDASAAGRLADGSLGTAFAQVMAAECALTPGPSPRGRGERGQINCAVAVFQVAQAARRADKNPERRYMGAKVRIRC